MLSAKDTVFSATATACCFFEQRFFVRKNPGRFLGLKKAFLQGILKNPTGWTWFFVWQNVVRCVAKLDKKLSLKWLKN